MSQQQGVTAGSAEIKFQDLTLDEKRIFRPIYVKHCQNQIDFKGIFIELKGNKEMLKKYKVYAEGMNLGLEVYMAELSIEESKGRMATAKAKMDSAKAGMDSAKAGMDLAQTRMDADRVAMDASLQRISQHQAHQDQLRRRIDKNNRAIDESRASLSAHAAQFADQVTVPGSYRGSSRTKY